MNDDDALIEVEVHTLHGPDPVLMETDLIMISFGSSPK